MFDDQENLRYPLEMLYGWAELEKTLQEVMKSGYAVKKQSAWKNLAAVPGRKFAWRNVEVRDQNNTN
jgi:hypothetical protein